MFKEEERNMKLRSQILTYFISSVMTDDERAVLLDLPRGCRIREGAKIICQENLVCGEYVWIGEGAILDASGGLEIGDHTTVGVGVLVCTHTSYLSNLAMDNRPGSSLIKRAKTRIGKGCFIVGPSVIYPGVTIGDKVVVLPMTVVNRDIPDYSFVTGAPAKIKKKITEEFIQKEINKLRAK